MIKVAKFGGSSLANAGCIAKVIEIIKNTTITSMVEVLSLPSVAFSKRKLITNFFKDLNKPSKEKLTVTEKVSNAEYELQEDMNGTSFFLKELVNGTPIIKELFDNNIEYIVLREYGIENIFEELLQDTKEYINEMIEKRRKLKSDTLMDITFGDKEEKAVENCIKAINKMSGNCNEDIVKKIKSTLLKSSCYDKFPYRDVADLLESKATLSEDYSLDEILARNLTPEMIQEIIISQSIYSLREYSYIHPKIKLIINQLNKVPMSLEFQVGE